MKTITDAVNEFKAEWPDHDSLSRGDCVLILQHKCDKSLISGATGYCEATYGLLSTEFEFLEHVAALTGCPIKLKKWQDSKSIEVKLVYTKAMQDAGEQIKVGMKFRTEAGEYIAELVNGLSVCFTDEFGFFVAINISLAKGIDTRTDKEKAIDDLFNLDELICNDIKWHENFLDGIIAGKITGVTWAGK